MQRLIPVTALAVTYFIFAILLNSVGVVILQSIETFAITKSQASVLEGFKDLSIAFVSFFVASIMPRIGYKLALLAGLFVVLALTVLTPLLPSFLTIKLLFAAIGVGFALVKVSVYSLIGQLTSNKNEHSSLMNTIEGIFMVGTLFGYWLFSNFVTDDANTPLSWLNIYWLLAGLIVLAIGLVSIAKLKQEGEAQANEGSSFSEFVEMLKLVYQPLVLVFVISIFLYVLIEQGVGTWLPTFNREVVGLSIEVSVQMTSIFAAGLALGRLAAGQVLKHVNWFYLLVVCLFAMSILVLMVMPLAQNASGIEVDSWQRAPLVAFLLPLIGFFMAPIYPILNSVMLSSLPRHRHAAMTGLIVVFSALGGTTGSIITGNVFQFFGGQTAFYFTLIPMAGLLFSIIQFKRKTDLFSVAERVNA